MQLLFFYNCFAVSIPFAFNLSPLASNFKYFYLSSCQCDKFLLPLRQLLKFVMKKSILLFITVILCVASSWACTSFIISGEATPTGRPMMFKHRDTGELNNRIAHFRGPKYTFIGLVNAPSLDGEVWAGMNQAGFCIMNTASYNLREDNLNCKMDREGELMYKALGLCATLADFEAWLATYPQPWGVEANFGVIDAQGGAAYYEMNNHRWIKYDVNAEASGYRVVTNFSFAGRQAEYKGWERYLTALAIMKEAFSPTQQMSATEAINLFSRQYRHELLGVNYNPQNAPQYIVDQDYIPRRITSSVVVFEGVTQPQNADQTLMWTVLGYPACAVAIPIVMHPDHIPAYMQARDLSATSGPTLHSEICDIAMLIKNKWIFPLKNSNGKYYVALQNVLSSTTDRPSIMHCTHLAEQSVINAFTPLYASWIQGQITNEAFYASYDQLATRWLQVYKSAFSTYLTK